MHSSGTQQARSASEQFPRSISEVLDSLMKDADAILLCYSLNDANSLKGIEFWLEELNRQKVDLNQSVFAVVGCKKDLDINAPTDAVLDLLKSRVFLHFDTSAKTAEGVDEMMKAVIEESAMRKMRKLEGELK